MSNWGMPLGVSTNDIPGNRPEDIAEEKFWEVLSRLAPDDKLPEEWYEDEGIAELVKIAHDLGYEAGRADGIAEEQITRALAEEAEAEKTA